MAKQNFKIAYTVLFIIVGIFYLLLFTLPKKAQGESFSEPCDLQEPAKIIIHDTFSSLLLKEEIKRLEIKFPDIVYAQARLETGNFKSNYFKKRNNLFGFRTKTGYMYFRHWKESVAYYAEWQKIYYKSGDYFEFLTAIGYAEADSVYKERVLACIK